MREREAGKVRKQGLCWGFFSFKKQKSVQSSSSMTRRLLMILFLSWMPQIRWQFFCPCSHGVEPSALSIFQMNRKLVCILCKHLTSGFIFPYLPFALFLHLFQFTSILLLCILFCFSKFFLTARWEISPPGLERVSHTKYLMTSQGPNFF